MFDLIAFMLLIGGIGYIYRGKTFIERRKSHELVGNHFHKEKVTFSGKFATIHGIANVIIGLFCLIWLILGWNTVIPRDSLWLWMAILVPSLTNIIIYGILVSNRDANRN